MYSELFNVISYVCGVPAVYVGQGNPARHSVKLVHILEYQYTVSVLLYRDS